MWYDEICKMKKETVQGAIRNFNLFKTEQNRREVFEYKKIIDITAENVNKSLTLIGPCK